VPRHDLTSVGCQDGEMICEGENEPETRGGTVTIAPAITKTRVRQAIQKYHRPLQLILSSRPKGLHK